MNSITERYLDVAIQESARTNVVTPRSMTWTEFVTLAQSESRTIDYTRAELDCMSGAQRNSIKDGDGFIGGHFVDNRRNNESLEYRSLLTLDADSAGPDFLTDWEKNFSNTAALIYSTFSYTPEKPRFRIVVPFTRNIDGTEYERVASSFMSSLGLRHFASDLPSSKKMAQMMYFPCSPRDVLPVFMVFDGSFFDPDIFLQKATPLSPAPPHERLLKENPLEKGGIIGAFCREYYPIQKAIDKFVPDYVPVNGMANRYTYKKGSTTGGVVIYDDRFSFSNHATDPASGLCCNAFDLVRLHKFGELDGGKEYEKEGERPSFKAMIELIRNDENLISARGKKAPDEYNTDWIKELETHLSPSNGDGHRPPSIENLEAMFLYHPDLRELLAFNEFSRRPVLTRPPAWRRNAGEMQDIDETHIRGICERFGMVGRDRISDAIQREIHAHPFHPVRDYLSSLTWDGAPRIATALNDFFGGTPTDYSRAISSLFFKAAVMRVSRPACKYDYILTVKGPQGCGKSTFFAKLGREWFTDSIKDLRNKDAVQDLQGRWIIEFSELAAFRKSDTELFKSFITTTVDRFRAPYGRYTEAYPRQCVFAATTNELGFLNDQTGNRRFLIFEAEKQATPSLNVFNDLTPEYINQLWAEAYSTVKADNFKTCLTLPRELAKTAAEIGEGFAKADPLADSITRGLDIPLPPLWEYRDQESRRLYIQDALKHGIDNEEKYALRQRICTAECWVELLGHYSTNDMTRADAQRINTILDNNPNWKRAKDKNGKASVLRFGPYGSQRGFVRM